MYTSSKIALTSAAFFTIIALAACGGGGSGSNAETSTTKEASTPSTSSIIPIAVVPGVPTIQYPEGSTFAPVFSSMYTLTNPASCGNFDPYCRLVAGKDAILDIELDASVTTFRLQITPTPSATLLPPTVAADCNDVCWKEARTKASAALHIPGTPLNKKGQNIFRVRIPAHLNYSDLYWSASFDGPVATDTGLVGKSYTPKPLTRNYFKGEPVDLVVVPMRINGVLPADFPNIFQIANNVGVKVPLPVATIRIGAIVDIPNVVMLKNSDDFNAALRAFTQQVGADVGHTYWYGIYNSTLSTGGFAGLGYQPGNSAIGWDNTTAWYRTMTHELGHNLGLAHTSCANPGASDPNYPYPNGDLYAPFPATPHRPFDLGEGREQNEDKDVMGYCGGNFFSDYHVANIWKFMQPGAVVPLYDVANNRAIATIPSKPIVLATISKAYTLEELRKRWDANPPQLTQAPTTMGHLFSWQSGHSTAMVLKKRTLVPEKALSGIAMDVQHPDGYWYAGVAYRTSEENSLDIWTPGVGTPVAIRLPGM